MLREKKLCQKKHIKSFWAIQIPALDVWVHTSPLNQAYIHTHYLKSNSDLPILRCRTLVWCSSQHRKRVSGITARTGEGFTGARESKPLLLHQESRDQPEVRVGSSHWGANWNPHGGSSAFYYLLVFIFLIKYWSFQHYLDVLPPNTLLVSMKKWKTFERFDLTTPQLYCL